MTTATGENLLTRNVAYTGERISVKSLEDGIQETRSRQNVQVEELKGLQEKNVKLQGALDEEIRKLRKLSDYMTTSRNVKGVVANLKELMSYIPGLRSLAISRRSIEDLLRQQYEISVRRVKEASEFADKLQSSEALLHDEMERLNEKIIESAKNEETAAEYVLELERHRAELESRIEKAAESSADKRELQAELDKLKRVMSEHSTLLQLYSTCEERVVRLKQNTQRLLDTIGNLASDIVQYVNAAGEKLDLVAGQIQALGTAADASVVMLEMKKSLDVMTESMNETTRFVSETQVFFRQNLDNLLDDLEIYDDTTQKVLDENLRLSQEIEERRISQGVQTAIERHKAGGGPAA